MSTANVSDDKYKQACTIVERLNLKGFVAYWAGGCVRDKIMGRIPKDYDIVTSARPPELLTVFPEAKPIGVAFGVMLVHSGPYAFEVATFRKDINYQDGRRPERVEFTDAEEDARRRDFTINGLFYDPIKEQVMDFVDGVSDIHAKHIRTIGEPHERFSEDYLRMLRAVRFAATLEFTIEEQTKKAIVEWAPRIKRITPERIREELTKILTESPRAGHGVRLLQETGLLPQILPEISAMIGVQQPPEYHPEGDVFVHTLLMLDAMKNPSPELAYSVLFHDVGKPPTFKIVEEHGKKRIRFDHHAQLGAEMTEAIMKRLRFSNEMTETVTHCVHNHMRFGDVHRMKKSTLMRLVAAPTYSTELELNRLDCISSHGDVSNYEFLQQFIRDLAAEPVLPKPWITGHDIMALGVPQGPDVGRWYHAAYEAQLENRFSDRDQLWAWLRDEISKAD